MNQLTQILIITLFLSPTLLADKKKEECEAELFTARKVINFDKATKNAIKLGIDRQVILEATFLYFVDTENNKGIISLHDDFSNHLKKFDLNKSKIFTTKEQWQSVIQYSLALKSLQNDDQINFKKHITEAYWLSPETASAFSHHITIQRNKKLIQKIVIKPNRELLTFKTNKKVTFKELIKDNDALILRFWSPWNQQLDTTYQLIHNAAIQCKKNKIGFVSILTGNDEELLTNAKAIMAEQKPALMTRWLADSNKNPLSKELRISDLPTIVIITKAGKIIYHGNARSNLFWSTLTKINSKIKKPNIK